LLALRQSIILKTIFLHFYSNTFLRYRLLLHLGNNITLRKSRKSISLEIIMSEYKPPYGKQVSLRSVNLPNVPAPPEEPIRGLESGKLVCIICGKLFGQKNGLERHRENAHGTPERPI
jgi:hypothetical protein